MILFFLVAIAIPFVGLGKFDIVLTAKADPTMTNGILTANAILFGFVTFDLRKIGKSYYSKLLISLPILAFLVAGVHQYFLDALTIGSPTVNTLILLTQILFFDLFWYIYVIVFLDDYLKSQSTLKS